MIHFSAENIKHLENLIEKSRLSKFFNSKFYRVSDTSLSYRQINSISSNNLIKIKNRKDGEWRKFSFKDLVFLELVKELRFFGFKDKQLIDLHASFYRNKPSDEKMLDDENFRRNYSAFSEIAMAAVLEGNNVFVMIDGEYFAEYLYAFDISAHAEHYKSLALVSLSKIMSNVSERVGLGEVVFKLYGSPHLNEKEAKLLQIIKDNGYKNITVKKQDGGISFIVKGEKNQQIKEKDLTKLIKDKEYAEIKIIKRDGKIVLVKVEDTFKI